MSFLITGATGNIGSLVVKGLLDRDVRPRVFVRDAEKARALFGERVDLAVGDMTDSVSLTRAMQGIDRLFLVNVGYGLETRDETATRVAKSSDVKKIVKLSSMDVRLRVGPGSWHIRGEEAIRASGLDFCFVQPGGFMSNALTWAASIKALAIVRASTGDGRIAFIHPRDIAEVAIKTLTTFQYDGESLPITGPEALSYAEMTTKIGKAIGKSVVFQSMTDDEARQRALAIGMNSVYVEALISLWRAIRDDRVSTVTANVQRVTGREPISFDQWARENAQAFL